MAGRPKGGRNQFRIDSVSKSVCLPKKLWDKLTEIGERQSKTPQKVASEMLTECLQRYIPTVSSDENRRGILNEQT